MRPQDETKDIEERGKTCENCNSPIPTNEWGMRRGHLTIIAVGSYDGFFDDPGQDSCRSFCPMMGMPDAATLCHDCAARLWAAFPVFARRWGGQGLHESRGEWPCCPYGYRLRQNERGEVVSVEWGDGSSRAM